MHRKFRPQAGWVVVVIALTALVTAVGCGRDQVASSADDFTVDGVTTESPDLNVTVDQVRGAVRDGYMEWACFLECGEPEGCRADLRVTVHYRSSRRPHEIVFTGPVDAAAGSRARLGRVQRPAVRVDSVDRVVIAVVGRHAPDGPPPTPRI